MRVRLRRLKHESGAGAFVPDAVASYTLFDDAVNPIDGATDVPMSFVAVPGRPDAGRYVGPLDADVTAELTPEACYTILIIGDAPDGSRIVKTIDCVARV
jgi:hypothetical protein